MAAGVSGGGTVLRPFDWYRNLAREGAARRDECFFLVEGVRAIGQIAASHPDAIDELLIGENVTLPVSFGRFPSRELSTRQLSSVAPSATPQGIIAVVRIPAGSCDATLPQHTGNRIVLLEHVQDPGNVGTIIRSAAAFGIDGVLLTRQCADPFGPKAVQATAGAILIPWIRRTDEYIEAVATLQRGGYRLFCAELRGDAAVDFSESARNIIAFGNEGAGLSERLLQCADYRFSIPMVPGAVESLNVAVSAAITMFAAFKTNGWR